MAETAAVLAPGKTVLLPEIEAGCPMADMINGRELRAWKARYPGLKVVCYVNTSAEVKAESDICCTSSNAVAVVNSLGVDGSCSFPTRTWPPTSPARRGRRSSPGTVIATSTTASGRGISEEARALHPGAEVWVHPECPLDVIDLADKVLSTGKMVAEARTTTGREVVIGTEKGIIYRLAKENPAVRFYPARESALCANMKMTTLAKVLRALEDGHPRVEVPSDIADRARGAIQAMLKIS